MLAAACASSGGSCAGIGQVGALLLQVQLAHRAAPGARRQDTHAVFQRGDVLARQPDLALGGAQFEVARQVAGQRQPGQVQQRGLADYVGVRPLDGAAHAAPQVQFPGRVEAGLI